VIGFGERSTDKSKVGRIKILNNLRVTLTAEKGVGGYLIRSGILLELDDSSDYSASSDVL
jgi:hypothetical protein